MICTFTLQLIFIFEENTRAALTLSHNVLPDDTHTGEKVQLTMESYFAAYWWIYFMNAVLLLLVIIGLYATIRQRKLVLLVDGLFLSFAAVYTIVVTVMKKIKANQGKPGVRMYTSVANVQMVVNIMFVPPHWQ